MKFIVDVVDDVFSINGNELRITPEDPYIYNEFYVDDVQYNSMEQALHHMMTLPTGES